MADGDDRVYMIDAEPADSNRAGTTMRFLYWYCPRERFARPPL